VSDPLAAFSGVSPVVRRNVQAYTTLIEEMNYAQDQFRQMIDEIPTLAWSCLPDSTGEFLNKQWLDYTGLSMEAALGWQWKSVVHADDLENLMETWLRHLRLYKYRSAAYFRRDGNGSR
jgi:PAS domain S-box-containing protein